MAESELGSKLVEEIAKNGDEIPEKYIHKNGYPEAIDDPDLWSNNLLIDFSLLSSSSTSELSKLRSALSQWGCFQVINHGIESTFLEELFEVCKEFFALPLEEKLKCSSPNEIIQGYGTDALYSRTQTLNWNDRLFLRLRPKEKVMPQCWPHKPHKFSGLIHEYSTKLTRVNEQICKAMAKSLNIEENWLSFGKEGPKIARFNLYPRCPIPNKILGSKPHSDGSTLTYLLPEKHVQGLQILKHDQWYNVLVIPGAIFVNFGDLGEVITNGLFKSAIHRVVPNAVKDRVSVAMFFVPDDDEEIKAISELVTVHQPQVYKTFHISEYVKKFMEDFAKGSRILDAFQL